MPFIRYSPTKLSVKTLAVIDQANKVIDQYQAQGFDLTLRQLYYQFVSRGYLDEGGWNTDPSTGSTNNQKNYKRLGDIVSSGRLAGLIDWDSISDLTRNFRKRSEWDNPADAILAIAQQYRMDLWKDQPVRPEVWIEKDAGLSVITETCNSWGIGYFSCRGYTSLSELWSAARRLRSYIDAGQTPIIFHLGDHDPSGIDMTRDLAHRVSHFLSNDLGRPFSLDIRRLALNMDQVEQYSPPPNPAKLTDSRSTKYIEKFGSESWELDALEPTVIRDLLVDNIETICNEDIFNSAYAIENNDRRSLSRIAKKWDSPEVRAFMKK